MLWLTWPAQAVPTALDASQESSEDLTISPAIALALPHSLEKSKHEVPEPVPCFIIKIKTKLFFRHCKEDSLSCGNRLPDMHRKSLKSYDISVNCVR